MHSINQHKLLSNITRLITSLRLQAFHADILGVLDYEHIHFFFFFLISEHIHFRLVHLAFALPRKRSFFQNFYIKKKKKKKKVFFPSLFYFTTLIFCTGAISWSLPKKISAPPPPLVKFYSLFMSYFRVTQKKFHLKNTSCPHRLNLCPRIHFLQCF